MKILEEMVQVKYTSLLARLSKALKCLRGPKVGNVKIPSFVWLHFNGGVLALSNSPRTSHKSIPGFTLLPPELVGIS